MKKQNRPAQPVVETNLVADARRTQQDKNYTADAAAESAKERTNKPFTPAI